MLVTDEVIYYKAPKHVASLIEPAAETLAVLVVCGAVLTRPDFEGLTLGLLAVVLSAGFVWRWVRQRTWGWPQFFWAVVIGYLLATNDIDPLILVPAVGLFFLGRLALSVLRWYKYEVRYLTNRRVIEARGFLGLRVASMPVTRITDLVLVRSSAGELFGYGELRIESAGQDQSLAHINHLVAPRTFHRLAVRLATKPAEIDLRSFIDVQRVRKMPR